MKSVNIACAGGAAYHAKDFSKRLLTYPECHLEAIWDNDEVRGRAWAEEMGCRFEPDYEALIHDESISGIVVTSDIGDHADLIIRAANAGKSIFVENGLTLTNEDAEAIRDAVKKNGVHFTLSDPIMKPPFVYAKGLFESGELGEITNARVRITNGEQLPISGSVDGRTKADGNTPFYGGLGHHVVCLLQYFLGEPESVTAIYSTMSDGAKKTGIPDNAVAVYRFKSGAIGVGETGGLTTSWPYEVQLYGTKGSVRATKGLLQYHLNGGDWIDVPESQWPEAHMYILRYWVHSIIDDFPNEMYGIDNAVLFTKMITAADASRGREIYI